MQAATREHPRGPMASLLEVGTPSNCVPSRFTRPGVGLAVTMVSLVVLFRISSRTRAGDWVGVPSVVSAVSLQIFGLLFPLPAMLIIRRELAVIGAVFIKTYSYLGLWAGIASVAAPPVAPSRWTALA